MKWAFSAMILAVAVLVLAAACPAQELSVWWAPAAEKVFRDTPARPVPDGGYEISCAGNETEACQLVLNPSVDTPKCTVAVSAFMSESGEKAAATVDVYEVHYVSVPSTKEKLWPDPLPPHLRPLDLKAGENQPFWIKVRVPEWHSAGAFKATVKITCDGVPLVRIPLKLTIYPFTLPVTPSLRTAFGIWKEGIEAQHGGCGDWAKLPNIYARYYEALLDHRISAYDVPFGLQDPKALQYLRDPRMTSFVIPYTENRDDFIATRKYLAKKGVFDKGFYYPLDEPVSKQSYDELKQRAAFIHNMTSGTGKVCSPFFRGPDFDTKHDIFTLLAKSLDIWCINTGYYGPEQQQKMEGRRKAGGELWWYVCCGPGAPKANFFVTMEAMRHRMLFWQAYKYHMDGLLYWSTTYWNPKVTKDPWEDMATVKDINPNLYGDGSLFYPGSKIGLNEPVSSQRLECILDGMEDFEYLAAVARALGPDVADRMADKLVVDMDKYCLDTAALAKTRSAIARMLSAAY